MSYSISGMKVPLTAGAAISAMRLVKVGAADNTVIHAVDAAAPIIGVAEFDVASGEQATVIVSGIARVKTGGVIARGAYVTAGADGVAVTAGVGVNAVGIALATSASGDEIPVLLMQNSEAL